MIYENYIDMREGIGPQGQRILTATERYAELDRNETFSLLSR